MTIRQHLTAFILAMTAFGCSQVDQGSDTAGNEVSAAAVQQEPLSGTTGVAADSVTFEEAFNRFFQALQTKDTAALNSFIDAQQGFWLIEQPGAVPSYTHYKNVQNVKRQHPNQAFTSITERVEQCQLQQRETFPSFSCADMDGGASGYAEDGCFYSTNTSEFQNTDMWQYDASLSEQQARQVQELQQQVDVTVLHTLSSYRFHFGYRNGRWQLLFADLRVPCSA